MAKETEAVGQPGGLWGLVIFIAKKDGVQGVLLLILCALLYNGQKKAEEAQKSFQASQDRAFAQLLDAHGRTIEAATQGNSAAQTVAAVVADNTRVLQRVERRLPRLRGEDG